MYQSQQTVVMNVLPIRYSAGSYSRTLRSFCIEQTARLTDRLRIGTEEKCTEEYDMMQMLR